VYIVCQKPLYVCHVIYREGTSDGDLVVSCPLPPLSLAAKAVGVALLYVGVAYICWISLWRACACARSTRLRF